MKCTLPPPLTPCDHMVLADKSSNSCVTVSLRSLGTLSESASDLETIFFKKSVLIFPLLCTCVWGPRVRFLEGAGNCSLNHCVQTGSGAHPASYPMGTKGSFPGDKAAGA
jgi:hypothetical protein